MEFLNEQQFNALTEAGKYNAYKDLGFKHYEEQFEWKRIVEIAINGNLFKISDYYSDFIKEIVDMFGYEYVIKKLIAAQAKMAEEESKDE